jgi:hypothetical protein
LFRIQHAPLLIPWPAITDIQVRHESFEDEYILTLNGAENPLRFFDSYGKTVLELWKRRQSDGG